MKTERFRVYYSTERKYFKWLPGKVFRSEDICANNWKQALRASVHRHNKDVSEILMYDKERIGRYQVLYSVSDRGYKSQYVLATISKFFNSESEADWAMRYE